MQTALRHRQNRPKKHREYVTKNRKQSHEKGLWSRCKVRAREREDREQHLAKTELKSNYPAARDLTLS